ncbi:MAG: flagellar hook protein FlgE [Myxococcota bacterium]
MSLFNTLNTGAAGMLSSSTSLSVIGDNIANIGTTGFKSGSATFADAFPSVVSGLGGVSQVGSGAMLSKVSSNFGQGALQQSGSAIDIAIVGQGFFQVTAGDESYYTRDGSFHISEESYLENAQGMRLQGYQAVDGTVTATVGDLRMTPNGIAHKPTSTVTLAATLSAAADASSDPFEDIRTATPLDGTSGAPTLDTLSQAADFTTSTTVYDSLGLSHTVTLFFERTSAAPDTWNVTAVVDGGQVDTNGDGAADGTPGSAYEIGTGTIQFDSEGKLTSSSGIAYNGGWTFPGADPTTADFQFGLDPAGNPTDGELRLSGESSYLTTVSQDGYAAGVLDSLRIESDGTIVGQYSNGQIQDLGRLAVATFAAQSGLDRVGGNLYRETLNSGAAALGFAGTGARGTTSGYALEGSNVDLEHEFVSMIQAQRSYQANTGVIRTADEALQQLIQLV